MPLSTPAPREHVHTRAITIEGFRRADGLYDIEAHLTDAKTFGQTNYDRGYIEPGEPIHDMRLRLTVDEQKQDALWRQVGEVTFKQHLDLHLFWLPVRIAVNPKVVSEWVFPGTITGSWTHLENKIGRAHV